MFTVVKLITLGFAAIVLSNCAITKSDPANEKFEAAKEKSTALLDAFASAYPGLSAAVQTGAQGRWSYVTGYADLENQTPVQTDTKFMVYSTAKALTGLAFAKLVEEGRVSLDTTVGDIAPDLPWHLHSIEIQHIFSHTSGVRHYTAPQDWLAFAQIRCETPADALSYFVADPLLFAPGTKEQYSSFAFVLASELLLRLTHEMRFADALNETLGPWATFESDSDNASKATPYVHTKLLPGAPKDALSDDITPMTNWSAECKFGGGGMITSSSELARAGAALYNGEIISHDVLLDKLQPWFDVSSIVYGGGIGARSNDYGTHHRWQLSGGAPGGRSYLLVLIEPQISVAIAGNLDGENMGKLANDIADIWLASSSRSEVK